MPNPQPLNNLLQRQNERLNNSKESVQNIAPGKPNKPAPACEYCSGQQYIRYDLPIGDPRFGNIYPCPKCNQEGIIRASGLNPNERKITLDALKCAGKPHTAEMLNAARAFCEGKFKGFLSIFGTYGNGKTTTLKGIVNAALSVGIEARYMTMTEVMVYAREAFESQKQGDTDYGRIARLASTRLLCIDELDKARLTEYSREVQTHLFDVRYRNADKFGTVVAWNGNIKTIPLPWVMSRLSEFTMIENLDADMRPIIGG